MAASAASLLNDIDGAAALRHPLHFRWIALVCTRVPWRQRCASCARFFILARHRGGSALRRSYFRAAR